MQTGADGENMFGQPMLFECMSICVLSPAHESEMRGDLVYVLTVKKLNSLILFKFGHSILGGRSYRGIWGGFFLTFLEGSVDHIICRDYTVNRRFFICCSLASPLACGRSGVHFSHLTQWNGCGSV